MPLWFRITALAVASLFVAADAGWALPQRSRAWQTLRGPAPPPYYKTILFHLSYDEPVASAVQWAADNIAGQTDASTDGILVDYVDLNEDGLDEIFITHQTLLWSNTPYMIFRRDGITFRYVGEITCASYDVVPDEFDGRPRLQETFRCGGGVYAWTQSAFDGRNIKLEWTRTECPQADCIAAPDDAHNLNGGEAPFDTQHQGP